MKAEQMSVMEDLERTVDSLLTILKPVEGGWQPSEQLPNFGKEGWHEEVKALQAEAEPLSDEMLVVLVGNIVTEEALPSYQTAFNRFRGMSDSTGTAPHAWAKWSRGWTAEEKRHGDVTRGYLLLSGRVDMRAVEDTIQHLIRNGFDTRADGDPYRGLAYASFQEHATKVSWHQLGSLVGSVGASRLHRICGLVAADEARHERVYVSLMRGVLERDPIGGLDAMRDVIGRAVVMPAVTMTDGRDNRLFAHFAEVGQRIGVYTHHDYAQNLAQLVETLGLAKMCGLPCEAEQARDEICALPDYHKAFADEGTSRAVRPVPFRWIYGRRA